MFYIGKIYEAMRDFLAPLGFINTKQAIDTLKSPKKIKKAMLSEDKQTTILYLDSDTHEIKLLGGASFSNIVFNPELRKGWGTYPRARWTFEGKPIIIVDPLIPYALTVDPAAYEYDPLKDPEYKILQQSLGLPKHMIRTTTEVLGSAAMEGFLSAFMDNKGSVIYMIFGGLLATALWFVLSILIGLLVLIL